MTEGNSPINVSYVLIDDEQRLIDVVSTIPAEGVVGLDTETFWDRTRNQNRVSLVQLAVPARDVLVIDVLNAGLEPLRPLLESPAPLLVAHNASFDRGVLAGEGIHPLGLIDTLQMSRMALSLGSYSLASVSEHLFGVALDKTLRMSNWRRRPLSRAQALYAALDARIVLLVYEELKRILEERGQFDAVLRASTLGAVSAPGKRRRRVKQELSPPLTTEETRVVKQLKMWRLARANSQRVAAYMVCTDKTLEHLARARPDTIEALGDIYGLGSSKISSFGEELLSALREACE
jgi:ribonuclease D